MYMYEAMILLVTVTSTANKTILQIKGNVKFLLDCIFTMNGHGTLQLDECKQIYIYISPSKLNDLR